MSRYAAFLKRLYLSGLTTVSWVVTPSVAWAQDEGSGGPSFVISYAMIILFVAGGLFLVTSCTRRKDRAKPEKWSGGPLGAQMASAGESENDKKKGAGKQSLYKRGPELCPQAQSALKIALIGLVPILGLVLGPIGLVQGLKAKKIVADNRRLTGAGLVLGAIIVGAVAVVENLVILVVLLMKLAG